MTWQAAREGASVGAVFEAALQAYLDHRIEVLVRRSRFRLGNIERRMEMLRGYMIVFLNLDELINK